MITRSQSKSLRIELPINIDFDNASLLWNANKKKMKNGTYKYVCGKNLKNGNFWGSCSSFRVSSVEVSFIYFQTNFKRLRISIKYYFPN